VAIFFFFRKIIVNLFNCKTFARFGPKNIKKGILCGNFLLFFLKNIANFFFNFEKYSPHLGQKTFCGEFSPTIWRKSFSKKIVQNIHFLTRKKKKKLNAMFLHIVQLSSQEI